MDIRLHPFTSQSLQPFCKYDSMMCANVVTCADGAIAHTCHWFYLYIHTVLVQLWALCCQMYYCWVWWGVP